VVEIPTLDSQTLVVHRGAPMDRIHHWIETKMNTDDSPGWSPLVPSVSKYHVFGSFVHICTPNQYNLIILTA
jgi:hypothetical protein